MAGGSAAGVQIQLVPGFCWEQQLSRDLLPLSLDLSLSRPEDPNSAGPSASQPDRMGPKPRDTSRDPLDLYLREFWCDIASPKP